MNKKLVEIKTKENDANVIDYLNKVVDEQMRKDAFEIVNLMQKVSNENPKMWGKSMIGFGNKRYKSEKTGREVDWLKIGFAPRKANLSLHLTIDINAHKKILQKLGKHKTGVGCLYINKLEDVNVNILEELINQAYQEK